MALADDKALKRVVINTAAGGTLAVVAGVAGQTIRVYAMELVFASVTTLDIQSGATTLTGAQTLSAKTLDPWRIGPNGVWIPHYECTEGETLNFVIGAAVQASGVVRYTQG